MLEHDADVQALLKEKASSEAVGLSENDLAFTFNYAAKKYSISFDNDAKDEQVWALFQRLFREEFVLAADVKGARSVVRHASSYHHIPVQEQLDDQGCVEAYFLARGYKAGLFSEARQLSSEKYECEEPDDGLEEPRTAYG